MSIYRDAHLTKIRPVNGDLYSNPLLNGSYHKKEKSPPRQERSDGTSGALSLEKKSFEYEAKIKELEEELFRAKKTIEAQLTYITRLESSRVCSSNQLHIVRKYLPLLYGFSCFQSEHISLKKKLGEHEEMTLFILKEEGLIYLNQSLCLLSLSPIAFTLLKEISTEQLLDAPFKEVANYVEEKEIEPLVGHHKNSKQVNSPSCLKRRDMEQVKQFDPFCSFEDGHGKKWVLIEYLLFHEYIEDFDALFQCSGVNQPFKDGEGKTWVPIEYALEKGKLKSCHYLFHHGVSEKEAFKRYGCRAGIRKGKLKWVDRALTYGGDVHQPFENGPCQYTPIEYGLSHEKIDLLKVIFTHYPVTVRFQDGKGNSWTPAQYVVSRGKQKSFNFLLSRGIDKKKTFQAYGLHGGILNERLEWITSALKSGADYNQPFRSMAGIDYTPIEYVLQKEKLGMLSCFLQWISPSSVFKDHCGREYTLVEFAILKEKPKSLSYLFKEGDPNQPIKLHNKGKYVPIEFALKKNRQKSLDVLLQHPRIDKKVVFKQYGLQAGVLNNNLKWIELAFTYHADLDQKVFKDESEKKYPFIEYVIAKKIEIFAQLLERNMIHLNGIFKSRFGTQYTPIHYILEKESVKSLEIASAYTDLHKKFKCADGQEYFPIEYTFKKGKAKSMHALFKLGVNRAKAFKEYGIIYGVNYNKIKWIEEAINNRANLTSYFKASFGDNCTLIEYALDGYHMGEKPECLYALFKQGVDPHEPFTSCDGRKYRPVEYALLKGKEKCCKILFQHFVKEEEAFKEYGIGAGMVNGKEDWIKKALSYGADPNKRFKGTISWEGSPIEYALKQNKPSYLKLLLRSKKVNPCATYKSHRGNEWVPIQYAIANFGGEKPKCLEVLLNYPIDPHQPFKEERGMWTPIEWALFHEKVESAGILFCHGIQPRKPFKSHDGKEYTPLEYVLKKNKKTCLEIVTKYSIS